MTLPYQEVFSSGSRQFRIEVKKSAENVLIQVFEILDGISLEVPQIGGKQPLTKSGKLSFDQDEALELQVEKVKSDILLLTSSESIGL